MARLGGLGRRARVKLDASMSDTAHGRAERCPHTSIPLCRINPKTPDVRYVILHELMHHQLNELGCPAIICPQLSRQHDGSLYLGRTLVPSFSACVSLSACVPCPQVGTELTLRRLSFFRQHPRTSRLTSIIHTYIRIHTHTHTHTHTHMRMYMHTHTHMCVCVCVCVCV
jgi:hypothetical protein